MDDNIARTLWCTTMGTDQPILFKIVVPGSAYVDTLKKLIVDELKNYHRVDAAGHQLRKLDRPIETIPPETLQTRIGQLGESTSEMKSHYKVHKYFPGQSREDFVHLVVQLPTSGPNLPPRKRPRLCEEGEDEDDSLKSGEVRRLSPNDKRREHAILYHLHTLLWKNPEALKEITECFEEEIPSLIPAPNPGTEGVDEEDGSTPTTIASELHKTSFINLKEVLAWTTDSDDELHLICPYFLIREEYKELDKYLDIRESILKKERSPLDDDPRTNTLLLGQPGIGKTIYLTYCLLKRLTVGLPTIFMPSPKYRYLLVDSGVYYFPTRESIRQSTLPELARRPLLGLALVDLNDTDNAPLNGWPNLVASSPKLDRYKEWRKQVNAGQYVMKTWSFDEIYSARRIVLKERSIDALRQSFIKWGGTARLLFDQTDDENEVQVQTAIENCNDIRNLFPRESFMDTTSHSLITFNPVSTDDVVERRFLVGEISSRYIYQRLMQERAVVLGQGMLEVFQALFRNNGTRSASGILFEGAGPPYLLPALQQPLHIRSLSEDHKQASLSLEHVTDLKYFGPDDINRFDQLDSFKYYQPLSSTVAGIDSFAIEVDKEGASTSVVLFQFTVMNERPINPSFLSRLFIKGTRASSMVKWKLIFVVPLEIEPTFQAQSWSPASIGSVWARRIDQYVLGVDPEKLWTPSQNRQQQTNTTVM